MLGGGHIPQYHRAIFYLLLTDDNRVLGIKVICLSQLRLQAPVAYRFYDSDAVLSQRRCQLYCLISGFITDIGKENLRSGQGGDGNPLFLQVENHPLYAGSEANGWGRLTPQFLNQVIVSSSATESTLGSFSLGLNLKYRSGIVVQPPNQAMVQFKGKSK